MATTNTSFGPPASGGSTWRQVIASGSVETLFGANCDIQFAYGPSTPDEYLVDYPLEAGAREVFPASFGANLYARPTAPSTRRHGHFIMILTPAS